MTPDTPSFSLSGLDAAIAAKRGNSDLEEKTDATWTEPEDGILQSVSRPASLDLV